MTAEKKNGDEQNEGVGDRSGQEVRLILVARVV